MNLNKIYLSEKSRSLSSNSVLVSPPTLPVAPLYRVTAARKVIDLILIIIVNTNTPFAWSIFRINAQHSAYQSTIARTREIEPSVSSMRCAVRQLLLRCGLWAVVPTVIESPGAQGFAAVQHMLVVVSLRDLWYRDAAQSSRWGHST